MASTTLPAPLRERVLRGFALHRERGDEIEHMGHGVYAVPGCSGGMYTVNLVPFGGTESCGCPDHQRTGTTCKHLAAATIYRAKSRAAALRTQRPKLSPDAIQANLARIDIPRG